MLKLLHFVFLAGFLYSSAGLAQFDLDRPTDLDIHPTDVIIWTAMQATQETNGQISVGLRLQTKDQFSIYADRLKIQGPEGFKVVQTQFPPSQQQKDPLSDGETEVYHGGDFLLSFEGFDHFRGEAFPISVTFLGCTERICLFPYTQTFEIPFYHSEGTSVLQPTSNTASTIATVSEASRDDLSWQEKFAGQLQGDNISLFWILLIAILGGLATNLTPCVFPMIPITIRLLGGQSKSPKLNSLIYAFGIVMTYTAIGSIVALTGGLFGALLANLWVNLFFGLLFVILGLSMLGFGNFAQLQSLGSRLGSQKSEKLNVLLMGAGAGLVAAPCTGPILGALLVYAAQQNDPSQSVLLFATYSIGFAIPYIFLGMAASRFKDFKVSAKIQLAVKTIFAAIMFGLALFYLKTPVHTWLRELQGYWGPSALLLTLIGIGLVTLLVNSSRFTNGKIPSIFSSAILGIGLFALSQWVSGADIPSKLRWYYEESAAYEAARQENKPILVDGWADWCAACKEMDVTTFQDPRLVQHLNENWIVLKLDLTEMDEDDSQLAEKYGMPGLPTLVLVPPNGNLSQSETITGLVSSDRLLKATQDFLRN